MVEAARRRLGRGDDADRHDDRGWRQKVTSLAGWQAIAAQYVMEWQMVWKDVLIGFTVAGIVAAFVPAAFFATLFVGSGGDQAQNPGFWAVLAQVLVGPIAAFFTFIGSMGNIPLAALLYGHGVSFAGVMAFIFSDLVVLPVLRINAGYYGWRMALYILAVLLACLVSAALALHYGLLALDLLPETRRTGAITDREFFALDTGFVMNIVFLAASAVMAGLWWRRRGFGHDQEGHDHDHDGDEPGWTDRLLPRLDHRGRSVACGWRAAAAPGRRRRIAVLRRHDIAAGQRRRVRRDAAG